MDTLTFGEQVKIMLSRRNMTIKELAEKIEEYTGKAMSRQNLTQRLGRDNFQEQDMRMIASILDCPFRLSIFPAEASQEEEQQESVLLNQKEVRMVESRRAKKEQSAELRAEGSSETEDSQMAGNHEAVSAAATEPQEEAFKMTPGVHETESQEIVQEEPEVKLAAEENDLTIGEWVGAYEKLDELEELAKQEGGIPSSGKIEEKLEEKTAKKERFRTGGIFIRKQGNIKNEPESAVEKKDKVSPQPADFEPVIQHQDIKEDLKAGEINPYTGREYQSNSVRIHPSRIGYVQVYDRAQHGWTDMTEWAFLGFQERKKALMGKDYEEPIYLD